MEQTRSDRTLLIGQVEGSFPVGLIVGSIQQTEMFTGQRGKRWLLTEYSTLKVIDKHPPGSSLKWFVCPSSVG